ncbi:endopeptidase IV [Aliidiomarina sedimenti]|uniref:Endopeptidase IV n=1 Tax=Aliidiomarina sedimenti TaxID=1933879 RepID=A0ABY0BYZ2_9GAMM|nr:enhanced serine sensitivity protein SseB [Aliidiomarina sedimenti]RUO29722.1 endopeptidase IV [Aliidiomarina sedimenti]
MEITEENKLEEILRLAAGEPAHRPQFCEVLLSSKVFVLGTTAEADTDGEVYLEAGSKIQIKHWEKADASPVIPFFSSLEVLQKSIEREESFLALPARSLFEMTEGARLVLNPMSEYGKEFSPEEVAQLLSIGISRAPSPRVVEKETKVLLGQPSNYPSRMVDSLTQLLAKHSNVKKAYLALMHDTSVDERPHLIVGIEAEGGSEKVMREAGNVAGDTAPDGEPVDLYPVHENEQGVSDYFINQTKPFYERKWGSRLRSWLGSGRA